MKNIKIPKRVGNDIVRYAYLDLITDSIKKLGDKYHTVHLQGYDTEADMVHFTYGGKRCVLYGVAIFGNSMETGKFAIQVIATNNGVRDVWLLPVNVKDFRFKTLDRIAYEVYDYCKGEDDPDYEEARRDCIAGWMDNYREFMS